MGTVLFADSVHSALTLRLEAMGYGCAHDYISPPEILSRQHMAVEGIVIRSRFHITREVMDMFPTLRWIARSGSGLENIDRVAANERGIQLFNSPEGNRDAVAEHAMGMLLSLLNHLPRANAEVKARQWNREKNRGTELKEKTVGIIGYGVMGEALALRLASFGCTVLAYDKYKSGFSSAIVVECTLDSLMQQADIISLHVPLTAETRGLLNDHFFNQLGKPVWLINTSRGPVVETEALNKALESGKVRGAALDVLEFEESSFEKIQLDQPSFARLAEFDNVLLSPHVAGWTVESYEKLSTVLADKIAAWRSIS
jgi:D-3-phosphoglycerate dehydrogenase / 2-oxoglutarate reductase